MNDLKLSYYVKRSILTCIYSHDWLLYDAKFYFKMLRNADRGHKILLIADTLTRVCKKCFVCVCVFFRYVV